jgi:hypothetical protein
VVVVVGLPPELFEPPQPARRERANNMQAGRASRMGGSLKRFNRWHGHNRRLKSDWSRGDDVYDESLPGQMKNRLTGELSHGRREAFRSRTLGQVFQGGEKGLSRLFRGRGRRLNVLQALVLGKALVRPQVRWLIWGGVHSDEAAVVGVPGSLRVGLDGLKTVSLSHLCCGVLGRNFARRLPMKEIKEHGFERIS